MADAVRQAVETTVLGSLALAEAGQADMVWGHLAVRDPEGRGVWLKAAGWGLEETTAERAVLVSWDGEVLGGSGRRHAEWPIHTEAMLAREDVTVSVHTHPPAVNAFSALEAPLRPISHDATVFAEHGLPRYTATANLVADRGLGAALARDLGAARACLMPQHGLLAVGSDVAHAVMHAVLLERACATQLAAQAAGEVRAWTDDEEALAKGRLMWSAGQIEAGWAYWARRVERSRR